MNVYDSGRMADALLPHGYLATERVDDADLVILNTCHIREKAAEKVYSELGRLQRLRVGRTRRRQRPRDRRGGLRRPGRGAETCWSARRYVDLVVGPQAYHRLPELLAPARARARRRARHGLSAREQIRPSARETAAPPGVSAFLTVQEGCDKFCTFCVVPYTRGAEALAAGAGDHRRGAAPGRRRARARSRCSART